jgi:hypothetical protein
LYMHNVEMNWMELIGWKLDGLNWLGENWMDWKLLNWIPQYISWLN